jgi:SAM-dependent methyltransferase
LWYRPQEGRFGGPGDRVLKWSRSTLARRLDRASPPGAILDVGAGDGTLVAALRSRGRDAIGLERQAYGPNVRSGEVEDIGGEWAAVVFWHSLEHLRLPSKALANAAALLRPGGVLVVAVPNYGSLQARAFGDRWFALDMPRHLVHLDSRRLGGRIRDLGLEVVRRSDLRGGQVFFGWLDGFVGSLPWGLDLYAAVRRPAARDKALNSRRRAAALIAALLLAPVAMLAAAAEVAVRRGGTVYLEARRPL